MNIRTSLTLWAAALARRAPLDLRVNTLKCDRESAAAELVDLNPVPTRWSPVGLRIVHAPVNSEGPDHA